MVGRLKSPCVVGALSVVKVPCLVAAFRSELRRPIACLQCGWCVVGAPAERAEEHRDVGAALVACVVMQGRRLS